MKFTAQIWMSSFLEFEMESDNQPTELEIIEAYQDLQEKGTGKWNTIDNPEVIYSETIDQTDSHENNREN